MNYLDSELATVKFINYNINNINNKVQQMIDNNIKICYLYYDNISSVEFKELELILKQHQNVFLKINYETFIKLCESEKINGQIIVYCEAEQLKNVCKLFKDIWFEVEYNKDLLKKYKRLRNIIIRVPETYLTGDVLIKECSNIKKLRLEKALISKDIIKQHPCNAYLCSGHSCHNTKGNFPRKLTVLSNGNIYIYEMIKEKWILGNIDKETISEIKEKWKQSNSCKSFIDLNKKVYEKYVFNGTYKILFWENCLKREE